MSLPWVECSDHRAVYRRRDPLHSFCLRSRSFATLAFSACSEGTSAAMELPHVSIAEMPLDERPRERMARGGAAALSDAELLALLIEPGRRGKSALDLARELVADGLLALARHEWIPGRRA